MTISIYTCKDGRERVYIKETQKVMSYPKYLMEQELGRPLMPNEEVHHRDENPLNNALENLEVRIHGEHQAEHSTKYHDTIATCGWCGKEFLWTGRRQRTFYANRRYGRNFSEKPFCSRECSGKYGRMIQERDHNSLRKLSSAQVEYIREHHTLYDGKYGSKALSEKFGVSESAIRYVIQGKTYKNE